MKSVLSMEFAISSSTMSVVCKDAAMFLINSECGPFVGSASIYAKSHFVVGGEGSAEVVGRVGQTPVASGGTWEAFVASQ